LRNLKPGYKHVIRVKIKRCGAYLGPNKTNWRQFMCHNLGANYNLDPFVPSANIHGDKYQWGYKDPYIKQKDDVYQSGNVSGWNRNNASSGYLHDPWTNGINDPCPDGYRVPTKTEWENVSKYNNINRIGAWGGTTSKNANAGIKFGDNLMLPTAGARLNRGATHEHQHGGGTLASYWTVGVRSRDFSYYVLNIFSNKSEIASRDYCDALPVRCIKR